MSRSDMKPCNILKEADKAGVVMSIGDIYSIRSAHRQGEIGKGGVKRVIIPGKVRGIFESLKKGAVNDLRRYFYQEFLAQEKYKTKRIYKARKKYTRHNPGLAFGRIKFEVYKYLKNIAPKSAFDVSPNKIVESMKKIGIYLTTKLLVIKTLI